MGKRTETVRCTITAVHVFIVFTLISGIAFAPLLGPWGDAVPEPSSSRQETAIILGTDSQAKVTRAGEPEIAWASFSSPTSSNNHTDVTMGDIDRDGRMDVVSACDVGIMVWTGDGLGNWNPASTGLPSSGTYNDIALADFNNDGKPDIAATQQDTGSGGGVHVWLGNGAGSWSEASTGLPTTNTYNAVVAGDVNNDGKMDIVTGHGAGVRAFLGDGAGSWTEASTDLPLAGAYYSVDLGDLNIDGFQDIVAAGDQGIQAWTGNDDNEWTLASAGLPSSGSFMAISLADFNSDGKLDLVGGRGDNQGIIVYNGDGQGIWTATFNLPFTGNYLAVDTGDVNHDGKVDIVAGSTAGIKVWLGDGADGWTENDTGLPGSGSYEGIGLGDVDGDARLDIVAANNTTPQGDGLVVYLGSVDRTVNCWEPFVSPTATGTYLDLASGDINNDGKMDIVAVGTFGVDCWTGNGAGSWNAADTGLPTAGTYTGVDIGDFDNDGKLDLAISGNAGVCVWRGDGAGSWNAEDAGLPASGSFEDVRFADFNNDGNLDVVCARGDNQGIIVYNGDGEAVWTATFYLPFTGSYYDVDVGDVNNDGKVDIVAANGARIAVWLGDGADGWTESTTGLPTTGDFREVALGDANGDGDLDIFGAVSGTGSVDVWSGDGAGGWAYSSMVSSGGLGAMVVADFSIDGDLDAVLGGNATTGGIRAFQGNSVGGWGYASTGLPEVGTRSGVAIVDVNGDGRLDVVVTNESLGTGYGIEVWLGNATVVVIPPLDHIALNSYSCTVDDGGWFQFSATGWSDPGETIMNLTWTPDWKLDSGVGSVDGAGTFTADAGVGGAVVNCSSLAEPGIYATASVEVVPCLYLHIQDAGLGSGERELLEGVIGDEAVPPTMDTLDLSSPGNYSVGTWVTQPYPANCYLNDSSGVDDWTFRVLGYVDATSTGSAYLFAEVRENDTDELLFKTPLDDEDVTEFDTLHEFTWTSDVPDPIVIQAGRRLNVTFYVNVTVPTGGPELDVLSDVDSYFEQKGIVADFASAQSWSDGGAYATLSQENVLTPVTKSYDYLTYGVGDKQAWYDTVNGGGFDPALKSTPDGDLTELSGVDYTNIESDDASNWQLTTPEAKWVHYKFFISESEADVTGIEVTYVVKSQAALAHNVSIWNHSASRYDLLESSTLGGVEEYLGPSHPITSNCGDYIDTGGEVNVMFFITDPGAASKYIQTDYIGLNVTYLATAYYLDVNLSFDSVQVADEHYLQLNYSISDGDALDVLVYNGSDWNDRGDLSSASFATWVYQLTANEYNGGGVMVRFVNRTLDQSDSELYLEYCRVRSYTPDEPVDAFTLGLDNYTISNSRINQYEMVIPLLPLDHIALSPGTVAMYMGGSQPFTAVGWDDVGELIENDSCVFVWESDDPGAVLMSSGGRNLSCQYQPGGVGTWKLWVNSSGVSRFAVISVVLAYSIGLVHGWNFVSSPLNGSVDVVGLVADTVGGEVVALQYYNASSGGWERWNRTKEDSGLGYMNNFAVVDQRAGFYLYFNDTGVVGDGVLTFYGSGLSDVASRRVTLQPGWNMIGYPTDTNRTVALSLGFLWTNGWILRVEGPSLTALSADDPMERGNGYWVYLDSPTPMTWDSPL